MPAAQASPPAVAVVTHNSAHDLERFLAGQAGLARAVGSPLVVVDNGSTDTTLAVIRERAGDATVVASPRNRGYAAAVNASFAAAPGRDVLLLNPDVEAPPPEAVEAMTEFMAERPRAGVVAPRLVGDDGVAQPSARRFPSLLAMLGSLPAASRVAVARRSYDEFVSPSWNERSARVDWVIGAAMLIRRRAFDDLGGWDERFFLYMEDADFCRRCARAGWEVWLVPSVVLRHRYARASSTNVSVFDSSARRRHIASLARLWSREPRLLIGRGRR